MMSETYESLEEIRRIKEECSLRYLSQTPEERAREAREAREWLEERLGRPVRTAGHPRRSRVADEEPARV
jgi:hypothetical protein